MSTIRSFEGFQPVSLKQEGDYQPSETDQLSTEEGDPGTDPEPRQISRQSSATESTLYPNPYHQPFVSRKYFATRPGAIETAIEDLKGHIAKTSGETIQGFWLLTEIDHWNNEKERILLVTDKSLLICKYDFIMLSCVQLQRIPLSSVYQICLGKFVFPGMSLDKRQGEGLRIYWGSLEEQSLFSRWNPWSTEVPYATFTEHPMKYTSEKFLEICKHLYAEATEDSLNEAYDEDWRHIQSSNLKTFIDLGKSILTVQRVLAMGMLRLKLMENKQNPTSVLLHSLASVKLSGFTSKLVPAIQNAHKNSTGSGRGKGLMVLTEPILIETYMGLMSFIGNRNKLGYSLARGSIGF
ncbi:tumor protein p63-regulated gene 1 protein isoform X2 [Halichoerus grypus]